MHRREATGKRSLFCALQKACIDVLGAYDHRRAALQEVRFAVEDATRGRDFEHRLRDFNNLPTTRLADIKKVLRVATDRVKSRLNRKDREASEARTMIRKLKDGRYRLYSRKKDPRTGKRRNLGTFATRAAAMKHERAVQFFKRGG